MAFGTFIFHIPSTYTPDDVNYYEIGIFDHVNTVYDPNPIGNPNAGKATIQKANLNSESKNYGDETSITDW